MGLDIEGAYAQVVEKMQNWVEGFFSMLPNLLVAVIVIVVFYLLAKLARTIISKSLGTFSRNHAVNKLVSSIFYIVVFITGLFIALGILNLDKTVTSILAGIGIAGLVIGLAFQDVAANFLAGIYMAIKSPINVGDIMKFEEVYGHVKDIGMRATTITTFQGQDVVIPNRLIMENQYSHFTVNGVRRIDLNVGISYGDDLEKAEQVTIAAIRKLEFLIKNSTVDLFYQEFGESSINFVVRYWIDFRKETDYLLALSSGIKNIKRAYEENGITITFPIRTLDFGIKGGKSLADMLKQAEGK